MDAKQHVRDDKVARLDEWRRHERECERSYVSRHPYPVDADSIEPHSHRYQVNRHKSERELTNASPEVEGEVPVVGQKKGMYDRIVVNCDRHRCTEKKGTYRRRGCAAK